jgi:hypothetical protein
MSEGRLYASTNSGSYAIGNVDGPDIKAGQAVDILLGGHWIAGHIAYGSGGLDPSGEGAANEPCLMTFTSSDGFTTKPCVVAI